MIDGLFNQTNYVATKKMLDLTALRHEAIASNLAHVETPRYKRLDVSANFATELQQAVSARDSQAISAMAPQLIVDPTAQPLRKDGNTVQLETELLKLNQNVIEHQVEAQLITGNLLKLRLAITGRG